MVCLGTPPLLCGSPICGKARRSAEMMAQVTTEFWCVRVVQPVPRSVGSTEVVPFVTPRRRRTCTTVFGPACRLNAGTASLARLVSPHADMQLVRLEVTFCAEKTDYRRAILSLPDIASTCGPQRPTRFLHFGPCPAFSVALLTSSDRQVLVKPDSDGNEYQHSMKRQNDEMPGRAARP